MVLVLLVIIAVFVLTKTTMVKFGALPKEEQLKKSNHYWSGKFHNIPSQSLASKENFKTHNNLIKALLAMIKNQKADITIPTKKSDLKSLKKSENIIVWFGHSSYFIQIDNISFLIDPVFSKVLPPIPFFLKAFKGTTNYSYQDIPDIDYLIITHNHWDHLDYNTVKNIKFKTAICPLGVGAHFKRWKLNNIIEMDWNEQTEIRNKIEIFCLPSQHFSGRGLIRNKSLWASFLIKTESNFKIFISCDSGYSSIFSEIKKRFETIELAILENGQYNKNWKDIHMFPNETVRAAIDLGAKKVPPVHNSKFCLSTHKWNDPLKQIFELSKDQSFKLLTPMIGEKVEIGNEDQKFKVWWEN